MMQIDPLTFVLAVYGSILFGAILAVLCVKVGLKARQESKPLGLFNYAKKKPGKVSPEMSMVEDLEDEERKRKLPPKDKDEDGLDG